MSTVACRFFCKDKCRQAHQRSGVSLNYDLISQHHKPSRRNWLRSARSREVENLEAWMNSRKAKG
jgi:hypothetical protein